jgi:hypothetical protein
MKLKKMKVEKKYKLLSTVNTDVAHPDSEKIYLFSTCFSIFLLVIYTRTNYTLYMLYGLHFH